MTDLAIRERVAREVMGWVRGSAAAGEPPWLSPVGSATERNQKKYHGMWPEHLLPAYENDIAAARLVEDRIAELGLQMQVQYAIELGKVVPGACYSYLTWAGVARMLYATPMQRCLAALAALEAK